MEDVLDLSCLPEEPRAATKHLLEKLINDIRPLITRIRDTICQFEEDESVVKIRDVFTLCLSQITKCIMNLIEIFRLEYSRLTVMKESRQCNLERLSWCHNRLLSIERNLERKCFNRNDESIDSINITTMYFVNWIDHAFEILNKLSVIVYDTDCKNNEETYGVWKNDIVECVSSLHISIDELLLCAMTLCKYCLPNDQNVIKARCQVVLRETKALLADLIEGDLSSTIVATKDTLKLPIKPSNINVMINVLKDVLYVLETNTNTALLGLLIHCFHSSCSPVDVLREHFVNNKNGMCSCELDSAQDVTEDCGYVKEFDLYNERLLQIGSFAVSCSSDESRILSLRSGLASLEALDPHLVPSLVTSSGSDHSTLLVKSWKQEVKEIRDNVFLIVDPVAFADKSKQMMHNRLLEVLKESGYNNKNVCSVINIGCVVYDFFNVYYQFEPKALEQYTEQLLPILENMEKVQTECKIVSNLLSTAADFVFDVKMPEKTATLEQLHKRLKLFYTLISRVNDVLQPKGDQTFDSDVYEEAVKNTTHTVAKNCDTFVNSPKNMSRSVFARTNVRTSTRNFPLSKLTKHLRCKNMSQLNFSSQLDELFNNSVVNKNVLRVREQSVLYNYSPIRNGSSLRRVVLNKYLQNNKNDCIENQDAISKDNLMDDSQSLQLTEVLNEMTNITEFLSTTITHLKPNVDANSVNTKNTFSKNFTTNSSNFTTTSNNFTTTSNNFTTNFSNFTTTSNNFTTTSNNFTTTSNNFTTASNFTTISKRIWNIPVNAINVDIPLEDSVISQPSDINTLERINDLDFVESKLNSLKYQCETSL